MTFVILFLVGVCIGALLKYVDMRVKHPKSPYHATDEPVLWFLGEVDLEIMRARTLHPGNKHLLAALMEEVGELAKAHLENEPYKRKRVEAMHVACVAARIALEHDGDFEDGGCEHD